MDVQRRALSIWSARRAAVVGVFDLRSAPHPLNALEEGAIRAVAGDQRTTPAAPLLDQYRPLALA